MFLGTCPENNSSDNYVGKSARRISERIIDHNGRDQNSHLFKHSCCKNHPDTSKTDFQIISSGFKNNYYTRKTAEALLIKQIKPWLNVQEKSYELKLLNCSSLFRNFFLVGVCLCRTHSIVSHCQSVGWFLYSCCWNRNSP